MVESISARHTIIASVAHLSIVSSSNLGGESAGIILVEHHNTGQSTVDLDFSSVVTEDGVHKLVVTLLGEFVINNSLVSSSSIRFIHVGWNFTVAILALSKLNVLGISLILRVAIRSLLNLDEVVENGQSLLVSNH